MSTLGTLLGAQDVQVGWDVFDDQFVVQSDDPVQAVALLTRPVQEQLLLFKSFADPHLAQKHSGAGRFELSLSGNSFELRMRGSLFHHEKVLMEFYQACSRIYDLLEPQLNSAMP